MVKVLTRVPRIRRLFQSVWRRLPKEERASIARFGLQVRTTREWQLPGISLQVDTACGQARAVAGGSVELLFTLPIARLYSDKALRGVVAHELGHAARAVRQGRRWQERMMASYAREERAADRLAETWGFGAELRQGRDVEHPRVLAVIQRRAPGITRRALARLRRDYERNRALWHDLKRISGTTIARSELTELARRHHVTEDVLLRLLGVPR
jgi:hypothetical protein